MSRSPMERLNIYSNRDELGPASILNNQGVQLHTNGRVREALSSYQQAVQMRMKVLRSVRKDSGSLDSLDSFDSFSESDTTRSKLNFEDITMEIEENRSIILDSSFESSFDSSFEQDQAKDTDSSNSNSNGISNSISNSSDNVVRSLPLYQDLCGAKPASFSDPIHTDSMCSDFEQSEIILYNMALAHFELSNTKKAEQLCRMALDLVPGHLTAAKTLNCLAQIRLYEADPREAMELLTEALHLEKEYFQLSKGETMEPLELDACVASTLALMGKIQFLHGYAAHSVDLCSEVLRLHEATYGSTSIQAAVAHFNLGLVQKSQGQHIDSLERMSRFINRVTEELPSNPHWVPQVAMAHHIAGTVQLETGNSDAALACLSHALEIRRHVHSPNHVHVAETLTSLGRAQFECGKFADAMKCFEEASQIPMQPEHIATVYCHIGHVHHANGDLHKALESYKQALNRATSAIEMATENIVNLLDVIGRILLQQGNTEEAMTYYADARNLQQGNPAGAEGGVVATQDAFLDLFEDCRFYPAAPAA